MADRVSIGNEVTARRRHRSRLPLDGWERGLLGLLVLLLGVLFAIVPGFWSGFGGFLALAENFLPAGLVALGLGTVILSGGIDLSVGSIAALGAVIAAQAWHGLGWSIWLASAVGVGCGAGLGLVNGLVITRARIEPLIATLATSFVYGSVAVALAGASPPSGFPDAFNAVGSGTLFDTPVPVQLALFAVLAVLFFFLLQRSAFGRRVRMIGYNPEAARWTGLRTDRVLLAAYVISGFMSALAGLVLAAYYSAVRPDMGDVLLLTAITTVVLGGISIFGGEGSIAGVAIAVLLLGFLRQGMLIAGYSDMVTTMVTGAILLAAIAARNLLGDRGRFLFRLRNRLRLNRPTGDPGPR
ncbi:MAG: ABC transporter permease [Gluconacetobacter diazotrophicus]|nr:ABC transporter permease [Gluconacetobacter diazotrophicus]